MKPRAFLTIFTAITLSVATPVYTLSRMNYGTPNEPTSVSDFSTPQNIGATVNSDAAEGAPFVTTNGLSLYFARNDAGFGSLDIWVSRRPTLTSAWGPAENLGAVINTAGVDNQPVLSSDGLTMLFNSSGRPDGFGGADLYRSTRTDVNNDLGWTEPINLGPQINTQFHEIGAAYFENPKAGRGTLTLYFSSNRAGDFDIYQSERDQNGNFGVPANVAAVNSGADDDGPTISRSGLEMLLSSDRQGGSSGKDIWASTRTSTSSTSVAPPGRRPFSLQRIECSALIQPMCVRDRGRSRRSRHGRRDGWHRRRGPGNHRWRSSC